MSEMTLGAGAARMPFKALLRSTAETWQARHPRSIDPACASGHAWRVLVAKDVQCLARAVGRLAEGAEVQHCERCKSLRVENRGEVTIIHPSAVDKSMLDTF